MTNQATRIIVKAAGELAIESAAPNEEIIPPGETAEDTLPEENSTRAQSNEEESVIDIEQYRPNIAADRSWYLSELDLGANGGSVLIPFHGST